MAITVSLTKALEDKLISDGISPNELIREFRIWKLGDEYGHPYFGKDGAYAKPELELKHHYLRHVHLVPLNDIAQISVWERNFRYKSRKTSDRALVYVDNRKNGFLLIFILDEPDAHNIAMMKTLQHKEIMEGFSEVANAFLWDGTILDR